ncbi:MAG TPA: ABC transporter ATP-binding protein [Candidatus Babeliales bacterium]|jgi:manganese/zinc/iron transport system ATP- binding protein|nr:ABC transporter ATP-binding protein [Candidatus Babeliales bacterium]
MYAIDVHNVTLAYQDRLALLQASCTIPTGSLCGIIGPNGAGKTTLLKSLVGLIQPITGSITIFGNTYNQVRKRVAYVPQRNQVDWDFPVTVFDVVMMGRYQHIGWFHWPSKDDKDVVYNALETMEMTSYANRPIAHLSGGQQQRVFLARALVQQADLYIMDEPFAGVDSATEDSMINLFRTLCNQGKTIVIVHHDLHTVSTYFNWTILINRAIISYGPTHTSYTQTYIDATYKRYMYISYAQKDL